MATFEHREHANKQLLDDEKPPSGSSKSKKGNDKPKMRPPTALDVLRYRYQYGVNLGGIFVLEKWISPSMFESWVKGESELDAATA